jgi:hypothetical protein
MPVEDSGMDKQKRSAEEIRRLIEEFLSSGLTRREFCQRHGIAVTALDYWRHTRKGKPRLVQVAVEAPQAGRGFVLVLANGRRIESSWKFAEADLLRLIRTAEA